MKYFAVYWIRCNFSELNLFGNVSHFRKLFSFSIKLDDGNGVRTEPSLNIIESLHFLYARRWFKATLNVHVFMLKCCDVCFMSINSYLIIGVGYRIDFDKALNCSLSNVTKPHICYSLSGRPKGQFNTNIVLIETHKMSQINRQWSTVRMKRYEQPLID